MINLNQLKYIFQNDGLLPLRLIREEAVKHADFCKKLKSKNLEAMEDLIYHIDCYLELKDVLLATAFPDLIPLNKLVKKKGIQALSCWKNSKQVDSYLEFVEEVEKERAVERAIICDLLKDFPIGF